MSPQPSQRNMLFTFDGENYGPLLKTPRALVPTIPKR